MQTSEIVTLKDLKDFEERIVKKMEQLFGQDEKLLTAKEAAKFLGNPRPSTMKFYRDSGRLKYRRTGKRRIVYSMRDLQEFMDEKN